ncbi:DegT/DnrJ/EryC1/StrS family aminotransferase [Geomonas sp. Red32]|uniref:DegT/DnrJ/EryC1/StrS family aminotransferase n=1 Tax=Geomonas sp. Red32 TaxID=2912856 RepID=UPI00202CFC96|nr:DegT/DnrJ/EryC1/StrS family aminotransferase [Geomonas sp. Red32]MCM0081185.1 DegT/DnrJ/EryC1/StrS family aminotransferase [Geomonas sp. Red32]
MMQIKFLDLAAQYGTIKPEIDEAIAGVIAESAFIGGKPVASFEKSFASYQQAEHCVGVANGTDALEIVLKGLELPAGSEVIVPANTFIATSEAVTSAGLKVVFCDCDPFTYTLSVADAERKITPATRAIVAVHLYGQPCDMDALMHLARQRGLTVVEDCAQAHGAQFKGQRVGTFGAAGTFSFYPGKNLGAYGDGGAIVTGDPELAKRCRMIANHGRIAKYDHEFEGRNSRLDGLQAAILETKLRHLEQWTEARRSLAARYSERLSGSGLVVPAVRDGLRHVFHLYVIQVEERERVQAVLKQEGIDCGVHYPVMLPLLGAYRHLGHTAADFPVAAGLMPRILSLPLYPELGEERQDRVIETLRRAVS